MSDNKSRNKAITATKIRGFRKGRVLPQKQQRTHEGLVEVVRRFIPIGSVIVDLGGREGFVADMLPEYDVTIMDFSPVAVEFAKERGHKAFVGDMEDFSYDGADAFIMSHSLEHCEHPERVVSSLYGVVVVEVPKQPNKGSGKYHATRFTDFEQLAEYFKGWAVLYQEEHDKIRTPIRGVFKFEG